jgi:hypothetical protein
MQDWSIPLMVATGAFLLVLLWRVRPLVGWGRQAGATRQALRDAHARIEAAANDADKATALCEAAELLAPTSARGFYLRAVRADPASSKVIDRVVAGLGRKPRALESVLWRHLASSAWAGTREATHASLSALISLYEGPLRDPTRAKALSSARDLLG